MIVYRVEDEQGRGCFTDNSTPVRYYIEEMLLLDVESGEYRPAQEDGLPVGEDWTYAFPTLEHARVRMADILDEIDEAGYLCVAYEAPGAIMATSGDQVAFRRSQARAGEQQSLR